MDILAKDHGSPRWRIGRHTNDTQVDGPNDWMESERRQTRTLEVDGSKGDGQGKLGATWHSRGMSELQESQYEKALNPTLGHY